MPVEIPDNFFEPPKQRPENWPDNPPLRNAVDWLKGYINSAEWRARRVAATNRLYNTALGEVEEADKGHFFAEADMFGWYLFLAEAFLDHMWNYEPMYGSRVVPVLTAIGRNLDALQNIAGIDDRVARLVGAERRQPNGGLFELLVASAYCRAGGVVRFLAERPGVERTHDLDVVLSGKTFAVECKRMETTEYGERERMRMRELWGPSVAGLNKAERSVFCDVHFVIPVDDVPFDYLTSKTKEWLASRLPSLLWRDDIGQGAIGEIDLHPLQNALRENNVLAAGTQIQQLLAGRYVRNANYLQVLRMKYADNPRYADECDHAILLRWESTSPAAIDAKAKDIFRKLVEANDQLPIGRPGIAHIGFEAVEGDAVEKLRYEKILSSAARFDPGTKQLEYVYCHYFVPESPPDQAWAYDETPG